MHDQVLQIASKLTVMKPNKIDDDNLKHLAKLEQIKLSAQYAADEKIDGCHYIMIANYFFSADHVEKTENFQHLKKFFSDLKMPNLILDGEIHYPGRTSQYATRVTGSSPSVAQIFQDNNGNIHYTLFDILRTPKGSWIINKTYKERRATLEYFYNTFVKGTSMEEFIHITEIEYINKQMFIDNILSEGREGAILKDLSSLYCMGRSSQWTWIKVKQEDEADFVIIGFEPPKKEYTGKSDLANWPYWDDDGGNGILMPVTKPYFNKWIGSIVLGAYVNGKLTKICTSSGMEDIYIVGDLSLNWG